MADDRELYRREVMKGFLASVVGAGVITDREQDEHLDANVSVDYAYFVRPDSAAVEDVAAATTVQKQGDGYVLDVPEDVTFEYVDDDTAFGGDHWQSPHEFFANDWRGDCEDYAIAVASLLEQNGYAARVVGDFSYPVAIGNPAEWAVSYVAAAFDGSRDQGHTVVETVIDGDYYVVDNITHPRIRPRDAVYGNRGQFDPDLMFGPATTEQYMRDWNDR